MVGRKKKQRELRKWIASDGALGEACAEYYVHIASKFLRMSYVELDTHPRKMDLMRTAFTLQIGIHEGLEDWKKNNESKLKLEGA